MANVTSLNLRRGTRIGQYEIVSKLGRGWEGEVYNVKEVPTDAPRAMKIVRHREGASVRDYTHIGWYFEQLGETGAVARYYHMGQWFLEDNEGLFYFVFERLRGENLQVWLRKRRRRLGAHEALGAAVAVASAIAKVHQKRVAVGDFEWGDNLIVLDDGATVKICDCDPGWADHTNVDFKNESRSSERCSTESSVLVAGTLSFGRRCKFSIVEPAASQRDAFYAMCTRPCMPSSSKRRATPTSNAQSRVS
jgi:serine/threonine protein kinase